MAFFEGFQSSNINREIDDVNKRFDEAIKKASNDSLKRNLEIERSATLTKIYEKHGKKVNGGFLE